MAEDSSFADFYRDLKETEREDSSLTSDKQIERLLRPGSSYRNLNPYEVLQLDPYLPIEQVRKRYKRLSILVHPDKNIKDRERAQLAFDSVKKAFSMLENEESKKKCEEIVEEAEGRTKILFQEKKRIIKKGEGIAEENSDQFKRSVQVLTAKLFADHERKRQQFQQKVAEDARKKRERELEIEERKSLEKEYAKNWEESRQGRVDSWQNFQTGKTKRNFKKKEKTSRFASMGFRPPKTKPESR